MMTIVFHALSFFFFHFYTTKKKQRGMHVDAHEASYSVLMVLFFKVSHNQHQRSIQDLTQHPASTVDVDHGIQSPDIRRIIDHRYYNNQHASAIHLNIGFFSSGNRPSSPLSGAFMKTSVFCAKHSLIHRILRHAPHSPHITLQSCRLVTRPMKPLANRPCIHILADRKSVV